MIEWGGGEESGFWWVRGKVGRSDLFIDKRGNSYYVTNFYGKEACTAGPFETLEAAKAALLVML